MQNCHEKSETDLHFHFPPCSIPILVVCAQAVEDRTQNLRKRVAFGLIAKDVGLWYRKAATDIELYFLT